MQAQHLARPRAGDSRRIQPQQGPAPKERSRCLIPLEGVGTQLARRQCLRLGHQQSSNALTLSLHSDEQQIEQIGFQRHKAQRSIISLRSPHIRSRNDRALEVVSIILKRITQLGLNIGKSLSLAGMPHGDKLLKPLRSVWSNLDRLHELGLVGDQESCPQDLALEAGKGAASQPLLDEALVIRKVAADQGQVK